MALLTYDTTCMPMVAMPRPLMAGPTNVPMMAVLATHAFAAINTVGPTIAERSRRERD